MRALESLCKRILRLLQFLLHLAFFKSIRFPRVTCTLALALGIFAASQLSHSQILLDFSDYLSSDTASVHNAATVRKLFGEKRSLFVLVRSQSGEPLSQAQNCQIDSWIGHIKSRFPDKVEPISPFEIRYPAYARDRLWYLPYLPGHCEQGRVLDLGPQRSLGESPWRQILTNRSGSDLLIELLLRDLPLTSRFGSFDYQLVKSINASLNSDFANSGLMAELTGQSVFFWYKLDAAAKDRMFNLAILALFLVMVRLLFGTWRGALLLVGNLALMGVTLFGLMAATRTPIDIVCNALFPVVCVAVVQDYLFLSHRRFCKPDEHWVSAFCRLLTPTFLTSFTTILGFGTLVVSELANIRAFACWAAFGALYEWILTLIVFPAFLKLFPSLQQWTAPTGRCSILVGRPRQWLDCLAAWSPPRWLAWCLAALVIPTIMSAFWLSVHDDPEKVFSAAHPIRVTTTYLLKERGWTSEASVIIRNHVPFEKRQRILSALKENEFVTLVHSPWDVEQELTRGLPATVAGLVRDDFRSSPAYQRYFSPAGDAQVRLFLGSSKTTSVVSIRHSLKALCPDGECFLSSALSSYEEVLQQILPTLLESFALSLVLIGSILAILVLARGELRNLGSVLFSSIWGVLVMLGVFHLLGEKISHITCVVASIFVGISGDNIIHYLLSKGKAHLEAGFRERGPASVCIVATMVVAVSPYFFSEFMHSQRLALLMSVGLLLILIGDLWLLRGLVQENPRPSRE